MVSINADFSFQWDNSENLSHCEKILSDFSERMRCWLFTWQTNCLIYQEILPQHCYLNSIFLLHIKNIKPFCKMCFYIFSSWECISWTENVSIWLLIKQGQPNHFILFDYQCQEGSIKISFSDSLWKHFSDVTAGLCYTDFYRGNGWRVSETLFSNDIPGIQIITMAWEKISSKHPSNSPSFNGFPSVAYQIFQEKKTDKKTSC